MDVRIKFLGGAGSVTGSKYLLEIDGYRIMIDCGLFQGLKELRLRNWDHLPIEPESIDCVVLTHAHIDHSGYLPRLVKEGYSKQVFCTEPTASLLEIMLLDAGRLQEEEAAFAKKKGYSKHEQPQPLFSEEDAKKVLPLLKSAPFHQYISINESITLRFFHAGHILGAASVEIEVKGAQQTKKLLFSGDLGPYHNPLHFAPEKVGFADVLLVESTYGNRSVAHVDIEDQFKDIIGKVQERGGVLLVPAFSVGRTQLILYILWKLLSEKRMPDWPVYIDSPMAISVTDLYRKFDDCHKLEDSAPGHYIFDHPNFIYARDRAISKSLNEKEKNCIIISASGMCTGGRVLHHLYHRLRKPKDTILMTGFMPEGSRGRRILDGEKTIKIFGEQVPVEANIQEIQGLSAHADRENLHQWLDGFVNPPKITFIVHGEKESSEALKEHLTRQNWNAIVPHYLESFEVFQGI